MRQRLNDDLEQGARETQSLASHTARIAHLQLVAPAEESSWQVEHYLEATQRPPTELLKNLSNDMDGTLDTSWKAGLRL